MRHGGWIFGASLVLLAAVASGAGAAKATFTAGGFLLSVDGSDATPVASVEGGNAIGQVAVSGGGAIPDKSLSGDLLVQPMLVRFVPGGAPALEGWLGDGLLPGTRRASGEVSLLDATGDSVSRRTFEQAGIRALVVPALDAASNEPLTLTAVLQPTSTTYATDSGSSGKLATKAAKAVLVSGFRLSIAGLDTSKVAKIDGFTVEQTLSGAGIPQAVAVPNLTIALGASTADGWFAWLEEMIASGGAESVERDGTIEILSGNQKNVVATLRLHGLGIVAIGAERADGWVTRKGAKNASERVRAELYCESVEYVSP